MRGFVPFKSCLGNGASSATQQVGTIRKGADRRNTITGDACARVAAGTRGADARRPTLVELDCHHRIVDRAGPGTTRRSAIGGRVPGNGHEISGDRGVQSAASGRCIVRAVRAVARSLSRPTVARAKDVGTASDRLPQVAARWNKMSATNAINAAGLSAGSSEKDCNV